MKMRFVLQLDRVHTVITPSQISRYVTSLVNHKNLIDLSLIEKTTDSSGSVITSYKKRTEEKLDIKSSTFDLIKKGMIGVVNGKDSSIKYLYEKQGMKVAGKTGTAQENKSVRTMHYLYLMLHMTIQILP